MAVGKNVYLAKMVWNARSSGKGGKRIRRNGNY